MIDLIQARWGDMALQQGVTIESQLDLADDLPSIMGVEGEIREALRDQLTGLFNRRFIDETLKIDIARAGRDGTPYSVAMIDVDHFKKFNDNYGHNVGDLVLATLGTHLARNVRQSDVACRYGGEEFLLLLPSTETGVAVQVMEKLRQSVESLRIRVDDTRQVGVTISCGIASFPSQAEEVDELVRNADGALYEAKRAGRNQVAAWQHAHGNAA